jgi:hypothetical protein
MFLPQKFTASATYQKMAERTDMVMIVPVGQHVKDGCEHSTSG